MTDAEIHHINMSMWTVYDHPTDYPLHYVAREFRISDGGPVVATNNVMVSLDLEILRRTLLVDMRKTCVTRRPGDDPKIVETWI